MENCETVLYLRCPEADVEVLNRDPHVQLQFAIESNNFSLVRKALQNGADINKQDSEGNTALHFAIQREVDMDILRILMLNNASVTTENKLGKSPLDYLKDGSSNIILNTLKLEESFDFTDCYGNTVMHVLLADKVDEIDSFWSGLLTEREHIKLDLNTQNQYGKTPLHLASYQCSASKHLPIILNNLDNVDLFVQDCRGDTFLHLYFAENNVQDDLEFSINLLAGKYRYCPKEVVKRLLQCQNYVKNTPFHSFLKNEYNEVNISILQVFLEGGVDLNACNSSGETALHCIVRNLSLRDFYVEEENEDENIEYLLKAGADINRQDGYGETAIFCSFQRKSMSVFLKMGADVNVRNKFGQTALLAHINADVDAKIIQMLLDHGADINAQDINGSGVLHYVAWHGAKHKIAIELKKRGVKDTCDKLGQLPCHIAHRQRNRILFGVLCSCDENVHDKKEIFTFKRHPMKYMELEKPKSSKLQTVVNRFQCFLGSSVTDVLNLTDIGSVKFEGEAEMLRSVVIQLVSRICKDISQDDSMLSNSVILSGSVGENTKVGLPDEFDFMCIFDKFGELCYLDEQKTNGSDFAYLRLKDSLNDKKCQRFFDEQGFLDPNALRSTFSRLLTAVLRRPETFDHPNVSFVDDDFKGAYFPTCQFSINWVGCVYKDLVIEIDLALAIQIKGWWPQNANIQNLACDSDDLRKEGCLLLLQTDLNENAGYISKLRISAANAELNHIKALPKIATDAYMISKIMCDNRICPDLLINDREMSAKAFVASYMLKTSMFQTFLTNESNPSENVYNYVLQIFQTLLGYSQEENLPSYIFPWQDIFTFKTDRLVLFPNLKASEENHKNCTYPNIFIKIILTILGKLQDFKCIDKAVLFDDSLIDSEMSRTTHFKH